MDNVKVEIGDAVIDVAHQPAANAMSVSVVTAQGYVFDGYVYGRDDENEKWAEAIALRISEESGYDAEDKLTLRLALTTAFLECPPAVKALIGTGIIEEGFFEEIG